MKKEELIGKKVRGFRFESDKNYGLQYMPNIMDKYVGKIGVIKEYNIMFENYGVKFEDGMSYHYPAERIEHHLIVEEEPTIEVNYNHISVRICEDNSLIGYYTDDCGITSFGKTFDELRRNLQHAKKAIEESRERLAKEDLERFEKSLDQSAEEFINDANRHIIENEIKENSNSIGIHKQEPTNPLDDLPIIGDGVLMEVSHCGNNWEQRNVWGKTTSNRYLTWDENFSNINLWKHARPITPKTKITRKEFESKFEIID
jgi:predicted RNase H-like HicB family nuclease